MKKKTIYKLISLCLTLLMAVSAFMPVKALSSTDTTSVTISGIDSNYGATVTAYKLINVNLDTNGNPMDPAYKWDNAVADWLSAHEYGDYVSADDNVTDAFEKLEDDSTEIKTLVDDLASAIRDGSLIVAPQESVDVEKGKTEANYTLEMGAYLFLVSDGVKIYAPGFARVYPEYDNERNQWVLSADTLDISLKSNKPEITKTVNGEGVSVAVGETVTYTVTIDVPQYGETVSDAKKAFVVSDEMASGLTFNNDVRITAKLNDADTDISQYFTLSQEEGKLFVYTAKYDELKAVIGDVTQITLTYTATVNNTAYATETLLNEAFLTYDVKPYETAVDLKTKNDTVQSYTYGLEITKQVDTVGDLVNGTQFTLSNAEGTELKFNQKDGYYYLDGNGSPTLEVDADGKIWIKGLDLGEYTLKEIKAPEGYTVPSEVTTIVLTDTAENFGELDAVNVSGPNVKEDGAVIDTTYKNQLDLIIMNYKNDFNLPTTGGMGTMIFTVAGILLMGGAVILMVFVLRKKKEQ